MTVRNADLEALIAKSPDDPAPYLVYADWLAEQGDPRGELITIGVQRATGSDTPALQQREAALHAQHDAAWLGPLATRDGVGLEWRYGFVKGVVIGGKPKGKHWGVVKIDLADTYAELRPLPVAALLRELRFDGFSDEDGEPSWASAVESLVEHGAVPTLRELDIDRGAYWDISWTQLGSVEPVYAVAPQLESLRIAIGHFELGAIDLPHLRSFETYTGGFTKENMQSVLAAKWPQLERLTLRFGNVEDYGAECQLDDVLPLLARSLPRLKHLAIGNAGFVNDIVAPLAKSPLLAQLDSLDLSLGTFGDTGARELLAHADAFRHLQHLDISRSYVSANVVAELQKLGPKLDADRQETDDDDDDEDEATRIANRFCQIGE